VTSITKIPNAWEVLLLSLWIPTRSFAGVAEQQVCDVGADYFPGMEEYSEAIHRPAEDERARVAEHYQPDRFIPSSRSDSWIRIGRRKGS
jgi:hypothetical protein